MTESEYLFLMLARNNSTTIDPKLDAALREYRESHLQVQRRYHTSFRDVRLMVEEFMFDHILAVCIIGLILCFVAIGWLAATGNFDEDAFWWGFNAANQ
jgi:hypothetical protein